MISPAVPSEGDVFGEVAPLPELCTGQSEPPGGVGAVGDRGGERVNRRTLLRGLSVELLLYVGSG